MTYDEIKKMIIDEDSLSVLLDSHKDIFNSVDKLADILLQKHISEPEQIRQIEQKLIAYYDKLAPIATLARNKLDMEEIKIYFKVKKDQKISQKEAEKIAEERLYNMYDSVLSFEVYTKCIDKTLTTCQSMLKSIDSGNKASSYDRSGDDFL